MDREWKHEKGADGLTFGERLAMLRGRSDLNQSEVKVHVLGGKPRASTVSAWETGETVPDANAIVRLTELFDVSPRYLLFGEGAAERPGGEEWTARAMQVMREVVLGKVEFALDEEGNTVLRKRPEKAIPSGEDAADRVAASDEVVQPRRRPDRRREDQGPPPGESDRRAGGE